MTQSWTFSDAIGIAMGAAVVMLAVHCAIGLIYRSWKVRSWRHVDGLLSYFNTYTINVYARGSALYNGTGIEAAYSYQYGAAQFTGKYVSVLDYPPALWATEYRDLVPGLKEAYEHKTAVPVLVNPEKPHQAVLSTQPISSQLQKSLLALLLGGFILWLQYIELVTPADWVYGVAGGVLLYLPLALGWLSTAF